MKFVDFHAHYLGSDWVVASQGGAPNAAWVHTAQRISGRADLVPALDRSGLDGRVLGAPPGLFRSSPVPVPNALLRAVNEHLAEIVADNPGRLYGLGSIDAFAESAPDNVEHAVGLGLHGVVIDAATDDVNGQLLLDAPQARGALTRAAELGVPVFAHPLSPTLLTRVLHDSGSPAAVALSRGSITTASLLALVGSGVLDELPSLQIVFPWLGGALGLLHLANSELGGRIRADAGADRWNIYVDIMSLDPGWIRYAVDRLGADHVVLGTDWPIRPKYTTRDEVETALVAAGLSEEERGLVAGENTLRLLARRQHASVVDRSHLALLGGGGRQ